MRISTDEVLKELRIKKSESKDIDSDLLAFEVDLNEVKPETVVNLLEKVKVKRQELKELKEEGVVKNG